MTRATAAAATATTRTRAMGMEDGGKRKGKEKEAGLPEVGWVLDISMTSLLVRSKNVKNVNKPITACNASPD